MLLLNFSSALGLAFHSHLTLFISFPHSNSSQFDGVYVALLLCGEFIYEWSQIRSFSRENSAPFSVSNKFQFSNRDLNFTEKKGKTLKNWVHLAKVWALWGKYRWLDNVCWIIKMARYKCKSSYEILREWKVIY